MPEYEVRPLPPPVWGLNKRDEPIHLDPKFSPYLKNMVVETTMVRKRLGYSEVGTNLPLTGIGMELIRYVDARGVAHHIALTSSNAYKYNADNDEWDEITPDAADFTGDAEDRWSYGNVTDVSTFTGNGGTALMISNGKDKPCYFEGQANDKFQYMTNEPANFAYTQELIEFWNHLFYVNPNDSNDHAKGMSYAALGDTSTWNGTGTSADVTLTDVTGTLLRCVKFLHDMVFYADESISVCRRIGTTTLFLIPTVMHELGLLSKRSVMPFAEYHVFIGDDEKFHKYKGTTQAPIICDEIAKAFFEELDISKKEMIVLGHDVGRHKLYFFFADASEAYATHYYAWNYDKAPQTMEYGQFYNSIRGVSRFSAGAAWTCDGTYFSGVNCDDVAIACDDAYGQTKKKQTIFLSHDGYIFMLDESFGSDNAQDIECIVDTPDLTVIQGSEFYHGRFGGFSFDARSALTGATVEVQYSIDCGITWTTLEDSPVTITQSWENYRCPCDVVARKCRFRLKQDSKKDLQVRNRAYEVQPREKR